MNKKIGNIFKGDKVIWMVFFFLCMISIIEVYSSSSSQTYKNGNYINHSVLGIDSRGGFKWWIKVGIFYGIPIPAFRIR